MLRSMSSRRRGRAASWAPTSPKRARAPPGLVACLTSPPSRQWQSRKLTTRRPATRATRTPDQVGPGIADREPGAVERFPRAGQPGGHEPVEAGRRRPRRVKRLPMREHRTQQLALRAEPGILGVAAEGSRQPNPSAPRKRVGIDAEQSAATGGMWMPAWDRTGLPGRLAVDESRFRSGHAAAPSVR
jgi:hypothetical protein